MSRIRDERGVFSDIWASGIMRRQCSRPAVGSQGEAASLIPSISLTPVSRRCAPWCRARVDPRRGARRTLRVPDLAQRERRSRGCWTGTTPLPTPPACRPCGAGDACEGIAMGELFGSSEAPHEQNLLRDCGQRRVYEVRHDGSPVPPSSTESSRRRVGHRVDDRGLQHPAPSPGCDRDRQRGLLSHSAIVGGEYGIPGVVGTRDGPTAFPTARSCAWTATRAR